MLLKYILTSFIIGLDIIYLTKGQEIAIPTNYTLSYFQSYDISTAIPCETDSDCPVYSKCQRFIHNEQTRLLCRFENFLCLEGDIEPCLYLNTNMWYITGQQVHWKYRTKKYRPILKTCPSRINIFIY